MAKAELGEEVRDGARVSLGTPASSEFYLFLIALLVRLCSGFFVLPVNQETFAHASEMLKLR